MVKNKLLLGLVFIILLVSFVSAQPPFNTRDEIFLENQIQIHLPEMRYYVQDSNLTLNFWVHNSTGYVLDNTTTDCMMSIMNQRGTILVQDELVYSTSTESFYYVFNYSNYTLSKNYEYAIYCNNSEEAGFNSAGIQINRGGEETEQNATILLSVFLMFALFLGFTSSAFIKSKNKYYKLIFGNLSSLLIMITVRMSAWFVELGFPAANNLVRTMNTFYSWSVTLFYFGLAISLLLLVYYVLSDLISRKKSKQNNWGVGKL
jgi:hypothetical protein